MMHFTGRKVADRRYYLTVPVTNPILLEQL